MFSENPGNLWSGMNARMEIKCGFCPRISYWTPMKRIGKHDLPPIKSFASEAFYEKGWRAVFTVNFWCSNPNVPMINPVLCPSCAVEAGPTEEADNRVLREASILAGKREAGKSTPEDDERYEELTPVLREIMNRGMSEEEIKNEEKLRAKIIAMEARWDAKERA